MGHRLSTTAPGPAVAAEKRGALLAANFKHFEVGRKVLVEP
jgi:hypothetical protein